MYKVAGSFALITGLALLVLAMLSRKQSVSRP
jgi:hypothetical protein